MKKIVLFLIAFISIKNGIAQDNAARYFSKEKLLETSVYYYPESWDRSQWERDIKNIASMGFGFLHFTDFKKVHTA